MEDDRVAMLEAQLAQAKLIAEESDKKYEEVNVTVYPERSVFCIACYIGSPHSFPRFSVHIIA
jgi:hypothetical protein